MFQLTEEEVNTMVSQNAIPSIQHLGGSQPYAFTEHGALQLASVIRSDRAIQMSIKIIEVFVKLREMLISHKDLLLELEKVKEKLGDDRKDIELIFYYLKQLEKATQEERIVKERKQIGFKSE